MAIDDHMSFQCMHKSWEDYKKRNTDIAWNTLPYSIY